MVAMRDPSGAALAVGRFTGWEPIGFEAGDNNWYRFVKNQPVEHSDPHGLDMVVNSAGTGKTAHQGIQVQVHNQDGSAGVLAAEFFGEDWRRNKCGSVCAVRGKISISYRSDPPATLMQGTLVKGSAAQDNILIDWILANIGKDRPWLASTIAADDFINKEFDGARAWSTYSIVRCRHCRSFAANAVDVYTSAGSALTSPTISINDTCPSFTVLVSGPGSGDPR